MTRHQCGWASGSPALAAGSAAPARVWLNVTETLGSGPSAKPGQVPELHASGPGIRTVSRGGQTSDKRGRLPVHPPGTWPRGREAVLVSQWGRRAVWLWKGPPSSSGLGLCRPPWVGEVFEADSSVGNSHPVLLGSRAHGFSGSGASWFQQMIRFHNRVSVGCSFRPSRIITQRRGPGSPADPWNQTGFQGLCLWGLSLSLSLALSPLKPYQGC